MDKDHIIQLVVGFAVTGWLGYVTNNVGVGTHERDELRKDMQYVKIDVSENTVLATEGLVNVWKYNDSEKDKKESEMKESFKFALEMIQKQHSTELEVKNLEIKFLSKN